jgi:hypothetical protein
VNKDYFLLVWKEYFDRLPVNLKRGLKIIKNSRGEQKLILQAKRDMKIPNIKVRVPKTPSTEMTLIFGEHLYPSGNEKQRGVIMCLDHYMD